MQSASQESNIIYCHGVPGSAAELELSITENCPRPYVLGPLDFDGFNQIILDSKHELAHVVGFSLGAMTALKIAAFYPEKISKLTLIAPAVPLELGHFLPHMAGQLVFNIASKGAVSLAVLTTIQRLGVALAPDQIIKTMFSGSPKPDLALLSNDIFKKSLISGLKSSFGENRRAYKTAVSEYVRSWAHHIKDIKCPVTIYHGSEDNWAPIEMAYALKNAVNSEVDIVVFENLGHYSTLQKALPIIYKSETTSTRADNSHFR